jgi:hypothetical protein
MATGIAFGYPRSSTAPFARHNRAAPNPAVESLGVAQARQAPPPADERLLDDISRRFAVADDQPSGRIETADGLGGQLRERIAIAGPCPNHQINVHRLDSPEWAPCPSLSLSVCRRRRFQNR